MATVDTLIRYCSKRRGGGSGANGARRSGTGTLPYHVSVSDTGTIRYRYIAIIISEPRRVPSSLVMAESGTSDRVRRSSVIPQMSEMSKPPLPLGLPPILKPCGGRPGSVNDNPRRHGRRTSVTINDGALEMILPAVARNQLTQAPPPHDMPWYRRVKNTVLRWEARNHVRCAGCCCLWPSCPRALKLVAYRH